MMPELSTTGLDADVRAQAVLVELMWNGVEPPQIERNLHAILDQLVDQSKNTALVSLAAAAGLIISQTVDPNAALRAFRIMLHGETEIRLREARNCQAC